MSALSVTSPAPRDVWRATLARDPDALVSQSPEWLDCMCSFGYADASRLYTTPRGTNVVVPMARSVRPWPGRFAARESFGPSWGMGGAISDGPVAPAEWRAVLSELRAHPSISTRIRPNPLHAGAWAEVGAQGVVSVPRLAHVLDLDGGPGEVWRRFTKSARWGVRKAERSGIEVECDSTGRLVPVFYELLSLSIERWARAQHEPLPLARWRAQRRDPLEKFQRMASTLGERMRVWVAWKDREPAAAMVVLLGTNASDTRGAMNKELAGPTNANDLVQWLAIQDACEAGCRNYHLGESGDSRSLAHYKEKFGARPVRYREYRMERLPIARVDAASRGLVKRVIGFQDA